MGGKRDIDGFEEAIRRTARLARLSFDGGDLARIEEKARAVIDYFRQLEELDTEGIEPTSHAVSVDSPLRGDEVRPSGSERELVRSAPETDGAFVQVPRVLEGD